MSTLKPDDGYIAYIINPKSGSSSGERTPGWRFEEYLLGRGYDVRTNITRSLEHACELATSAGNDNDCSMVLIVPGGTENLLANELGLDKSLKTLTETFEAGYTRPFDLGNANGKCFTSIAGFGFDGEIVKGVSSKRTGHINYFDYFWPIWRTFWRYRFDSMDVVVDGEKIFDGRGLVFVGNISRYALGLNILDRADFSDGLLDICIYKCTSRSKLVKHSVWTVFNQHVRSSDVIYRQGKKIIVRSDNPDLATEIDGDPGPTIPVEINIIPNAVRVMVLPGSRPAGIRKQILRALR
jgi:diacylglycerol kinase (ATP)